MLSLAVGVVDLRKRANLTVHSDEWHAGGTWRLGDRKMGQEDQQTKSVVDAAERQAVTEYVAAVILEAWRQADLVAQLLHRVLGHDHMPATDTAGILAKSDLPVGPAVDFLLDLGALARVAECEDAKLSRHLPADFPAADEIRDEMRNALQGTSRYSSTGISRRLLVTWLACFAWDGRNVLGGDVVVQGSPMESEDVIERLAEFLWKNRHRLSDEN